MEKLVASNQIVYRSLRPACNGAFGNVRYLDQETEKSCDYGRSRGLVVKTFDKDHPSPSPAIDMSIVEETLKKSETLWGGSLPYWLRISKAEEGDVLARTEAVSEVEASSSEDEFIVVAYTEASFHYPASCCHSSETHAPRAGGILTDP